MLQFSIAAAKSCKRLRQPQWSIKLASLRAHVSMLQRILSIYRTRINHVSKLQEFVSKHALTFSIPPTIAACQTALRKAQQECRAIAAESMKHRHDEIHQKIAQAKAAGTTAAKKQARILRHIIKAEEIKMMYKKIRRLRAKATSGITCIEVPCDPSENPKQCQHWRTVDTPDEVVQVLLNRNQKHFGQAKGTPLTCPPLSQDIDYTANTITTELILEGNYDPESIEEATRALVQSLQRRQYADHPPRPAETPWFSEQDLLEKIRCWKESTSTSPSGLHLGHWKALVARHSYSHDNADPVKKLQLDQIRDQLIEIRLNLLNYAAKHAYSFTRWQNIVNVMILKEAGNIKIHRLRVIHLYEADYNMFLGIKWRGITQLAEDFDKFNEGTYGSRTGRSALIPPFMEEMMTEISRLTRKSLVKFDNDATSCYDRILPSLASIVSQKYGMHKNVTLVMAQTLQEAKYRLKTDLGISEEFYQHCDLFPIYGTGQGSANSPAIWCFISNTLFDCFDAKAHGAIFESPDKSISVRLFMVGFVDDTTCQVNDFLDDTQPPICHTLKKMEHDAQWWNDLLWAASGDLELPKCTYHVLYYMFTPSGSPILAPNNSSAMIQIRKGDRTGTQSVKQLSPFSAHKTLGHYKEPSGNQTAQQTALRKKCEDYCELLRCGPLNHTEAWTFYFAVLMPSLGFPLPNCFFTESQLDKTQRPVFRELFAKCGFNRNTKREILFGPAEFGGASFRSLYSEQGVGQVLSFLQLWRTEGQASTLLRIAVAWAQYCAGTSIPIFEDVHSLLPHLETKWLTSLRAYLARIDGSLELDDTSILPPQREHDQYLMDIALASAQFCPEDIKRINYCRMHLQVLTISDISNAAGTGIDPTKYHGNPSLLSSRSKCHHINQEKPNDASWQVWKRFCDTFLTLDYQLRQPLGRWTIPMTQARMEPAAAVSLSEMYCYIRATDRYISHVITSPGLVGSPVDEDIILPDDAIPVDIVDDNGQWQYSGLQGTDVPPPSNPSTEFLDRLEPWEEALFADLDLLLPPFEVLQKLQQARFLIASDGSVRQHGTFGWVICHPSGERLARCSGPVFGCSPSSYRAEAYGMLSAFRFLFRLQEFTDDTLGEGFHLYCDNESLVQNVSDIAAPPEADIPWEDIHLNVDPDAEYRLKSRMGVTTSSDWDVLQEIHTTRMTLKAETKGVLWIKGHQDEKTPYEALTLPAQLNVDADRLAVEHHETHDPPIDVMKVLRFPGNHVQLQLPTGTITGHYKHHLRFSQTAPQLMEYIRTRYKWDQATFSSVDWQAHGRALKRQRNRVSTIKLVHDLTPTNSITARYSKFRSAKCPRCSHDHEDRDHVLRCPASAPWRQRLLQNLRKRCDMLHTHPSLRDLLLTGIETWLDDDTIDLPTFPRRYHSLIQSQNAIGWRQLFNGRLSNKWSTMQDTHLLQCGLRTKDRTGPLWTKTIITTIWTHWSELWEIRNKANQGNASSELGTRRRQEALAELQYYYNHIRDMLPADRKFLMDSYETHAQLPTTTILNWLEGHREVLSNSIKTAKRLATKGVRNIASYFTVLARDG
jgi:hypothetical protein